MKTAGFVRRLVALLRKEFRQMVRDRSNLAVGLLLPAVLILLFGYGLSLDLPNAPVAVVMEDRSPTARDVLSGLDGSRFLSPVWVGSMQEAEARVRSGEVEGIVRVPQDFSSRLAAGDARIQVVTNGSSSSTALAVEGFVSGAIGTWAQQRAARAGTAAPSTGAVEVVPRMWFNEAGNSTWYLVPGLIVLVMTLIGAFLTSLLIAREWERGTLESLFITPVRPIELVLSKLIPYLVVGAIDLVLCLLAARFLFHVPMRGSLGIIFLLSMLYLTVSLLVGLFISGVTRNQFEASQVALVTSFMPALMLSGFVFDLRNVPVPVRVVSHVLPATHFMGVIKTLFLAGNDWAAVLKSTAILSAYAMGLLWATQRTVHKRLD